MIEAGSLFIRGSALLRLLAKLLLLRELSSQPLLKLPLGFLLERAEVSRLPGE